MITPEMLARSGTEHGEQCALFCWAGLPDVRAKYPCLEWMHAIPNSGARGNKVAAGQLKAEGVKSGVADIFLPMQRKILQCDIVGIYVEMKKVDGVISDFTEAQLKFAKFVLSQNYAWIPAFGWRQASHAIELYLEGERYKPVEKQIKVIAKINAMPAMPCFYA